ncbi:MAG TPA: nucleoside-diphosphate sugar epimerase/dehydratase [Actinomycetales bacterium]|nr:nucleoside-diphosphate sugar epimerase/dehydratase [Actinomycetales bacterium]
MWSNLPAKAGRVRGELLYAVLDVVIVLFAFATVLQLRYDGSVPERMWPRFFTFVAIAAGTFVACHYMAGLYGRIWRYASILEARRLLLSGAAATVILISVVTIGPRLVPHLVAGIGAVFTTMVIGLARFQSRLFALRRETERPAGLRVVVCGAGSAGVSLVRQMTAEGAGLVPVAFLDDDPRLRGRVIHGVRVEGPLSDLVEVCRATGAHQVLLAVADAPPALVRQLSDDAEAAGAAMRVVPGLDRLLTGDVRLADVRDVRIEDLLGREQVTTDLTGVHRLLSGRRVLITGAGGSIGSEIARQVAAAAPAELVLLDHDETHLHDVASTLNEEHVIALVDLRDPDRVEALLRRHRPEVVFHAAAHKHVPVLEQHPGEAVRTNVTGTRMLLDACVRHGVGSFVLISTDKAVTPSSVMGASKRVAEYLVLDAARRAGLRYCGVRFGNVLGSRGSVIPTFVRQIEQGGPVTVTDPRMTRYFMSIPEAVQLVLQAAAMADGGEIFMLEMGQPVAIVDLAKKMIRLSGRRVGTDVELRITGIRPGEKLEEDLRTTDEEPLPTAHPSVVRLIPQQPSEQAVAQRVSDLERLATVGDTEEIRRLVLRLGRSPLYWEDNPVLIPRQQVNGTELSRETHDAR